MLLRRLVATGFLATLAGIAAAQCDCPCEGEETPPEEVYPAPTPEECAPENPDRPWYCDIGLAPEKPDPIRQFTDEATGFNFIEYGAEYSIASLDLVRIYYRFAVPETVPEDATGFDVVVQIEAPNEIGWAGIAWGATMTSNPLSVVWANCNSATVSSRWADTRTLPVPYDYATYTVLNGATFANETHFTITFKCVGCTSWTANGATTTLKRDGINSFAFASSYTPPEEPANNMTSFPYHDVHGTYELDFSQGINTDFDALVEKVKAAEPPKFVSSDPDADEDTCLYYNELTPPPPITVTETHTVTVATATVTVTATAAPCTPTP